MLDTEVPICISTQAHIFSHFYSRLMMVGSSAGANCEHILVPKSVFYQTDGSGIRVGIQW